MTIGLAASDVAGEVAAIMSNQVAYSIQDEVAVITIDNPPVNALSPAVAEGLAGALVWASDNPSVSSVVMIGSGRTFIAGADIAVLQEMAWAEKPSGPQFHDLLLQIEDSVKPVVMAIHGTALGGGLEVAMAGHYRIAVGAAQFGQPEVNLGVIPGAEGTQRLPRLVGVEKAIEMCVTGKSLSAAEALKAGLIDFVVGGKLPGALFDAAIQFARDVRGTRKTREQAERLGTAEENAPLFAAGRELAAKTRRLQNAPLRAVEAIEAATTLPFSDGCRREHEIFLECLKTDQAKSMMYAFFAERSAMKVPGLGKSVPTYPIRRVAVVGAGTMGGGITMTFVNAGIPVLLKETDEIALNKGLATIRRNYETSVKRGRFSAAEVEERLQLIDPRLDMTDLATVDLIVEAVFENMAVKKQVLQELDAVARPDCILATNTSTLNVDELAAATSRPDLVVGMHFFSPANVMRLMEIVRGRATSLEVIATAMALAKQLKKIGVLVGNCPGFVGNRMFFPYMYEAQFLVEEGADPLQVDRALTEFGMAMGIFAVDDLAGIDVAWRVRQEMGHFSTAGVRKPLVQDRLYAMGRYGQKTRRGWYLYGEDRAGVPDPEVLMMIEEAAREAGLARRPFGSEEIIERLLYMLVNEGARLLEEGCALRSSDIDVIYTNGYGFPAWRGGPMFFAELTGLEKVLNAIERFHAEMGERWAPAPLLKRLVAERRTFRDFDQDNQRGV